MGYIHVGWGFNWIVYIHYTKNQQITSQEIRHEQYLPITHFLLHMTSKAKKQSNNKK